MYAVFKNRTQKCRSKIFLQSFQEIYELSGHQFTTVDSITKRYTNCFFKGLAKKESDQVTFDKAAQVSEKKRKLASN